MKIAISFILVLSLFFAISATGLAAFQDTLGHEKESAITRAEAAGIVHGYPDGTFKPNADTTSAEFVKMLLAAMRLTRDSETSAWLKSASDDYYSSHKSDFAAISSSWLTQQGWTETAVNFGLITSGSTFEPERAITRSEAGAMLKIMLGQSEIPETVMSAPSGERLKRADAAEIVLRAAEYAERGVDLAINVTVVVTDYNSDGETVSKTIAKTVPAQSIDGTIFVSARALFTASDELSAAIIPNANLIKWTPAQTFSFAWNFWIATYTPGLRTIETVQLNGFPEDKSFSWNIAPHLLRGELMIPVYPAQQSGALPDMKSTYDAGTKTLTVKLDWYVQSLSS